jgi:hypothetical protein
VPTKVTRNCWMKLGFHIEQPPEWEPSGSVHFGLCHLPFRLDIGILSPPKL